MASVESPFDHCDVEELLTKSPTIDPDFVIDGIHFGRGESYYDEATSTQLTHNTTELKCWRIVNEKLKEVDDKSMNRFYTAETYIVRWRSVTDSFRFNTDGILDRRENEIYFYWKGDDAAKGFSPLPTAIEKDNPPVERIVQWAEPPAFLHLFSGTFIVNIGKEKSSSTNPHLYILRGEMDKELHLYEVPLKKQNLRSRTSFVVHYPKENTSIVWHGGKSNSHAKDLIRKATEKIFGSDFTEINEGAESDQFRKLFLYDKSEFFINPASKIVDYTPRLFYLNEITGNFLATEIECSHRSFHLTPFPFVQTHLYTAEQPAIFLLDDNDEIWIWHGWQRNDNDDTFKTKCFVMAMDYAKQKSKNIKKLVKLHKVIAGFEPDSFTNLFPTWKKREDIARLQEKDGLLPNASSPLIEVMEHA